MDVLLKPVARHVAHGLELTPNDGVVSVESAIWGDFLGCVPADHADEIGQFGDEGTNGRTGWNHVRFYRNHAFALAEAGF
jgi:triacylglycerol esterase/lipase EstA (alpha/beta hydrolase family)